jgi:hypothetical protein
MTFLYEMLTYIIAYMSFGQDEKLLPFLIVFLISLSCLYATKKNPYVFYGLSLLQFVSLYLLSLPLTVIFFLTVLFYVMYMNVKKEQHYYVVASFGFVVLSMLTDLGMAYRMVVLLLLLQAILYLMISSKTMYERKWRLFTLALLSFCTWIIVHFSDVMQVIVKTVFSQTFTSLVTLAGYVVGFIGQFISVEKLEEVEKEESEQQQTQAGEQPQQELPLEMTTGVDDVGPIFLMICIGVIAYFIVKKMKKRKGIQAKEGMSTPTTVDRHHHLFGINVRPPKNPVRNKVFHLEKQMKGSYARNRGETFEQWMFRLRNVQKLPIEPEEIIAIYNQVRYDDATASKEDVKRLADFYKKLRKMRE